MTGDLSASESSRSSSAERRALGRPIDPSPGWKGEARGDREDDGLGTEGCTRKMSSLDAGLGHCGELGAEASSSSETSSTRTSDSSSTSRDSGWAAVGGRARDGSPVGLRGARVDGDRPRRRRGHGWRRQLCRGRSGLHRRCWQWRGLPANGRGARTRPSGLSAFAGRGGDGHGSSSLQRRRRGRSGWGDVGSGPLARLRRAHRLGTGGGTRLGRHGVRRKWRILHARPWGGRGWLWRWMGRWGAGG